MLSFLKICFHISQPTEDNPEDLQRQTSFMVTIRNGKKALSECMANMQNPVELQLDTEEEKNAHLKTSWKSIVSEISAMNSATAQMVTIKPIQIILCLTMLFFISFIVYYFFKHFLDTIIRNRKQP